MIDGNWILLLILVVLFCGILLRVAAGALPSRSDTPQSIGVTVCTDLEELASLRIALEQLNERGRHYGTVLWQVPFAYLGLAGLAVGAVIEKKPEFLPFILLGTGFAGWAVLIHTCALLEGNRRAVREIRYVEARLGLRRTAKWGARSTTMPLLLLIVAAAAAGTLLGTRQLVLQPPMAVPAPGWQSISTTILSLVGLWFSWRSTEPEPPEDSCVGGHTPVAGGNETRPSPAEPAAAPDGRAST